jgi:hypothetical protein
LLRHFHIYGFAVGKAGRLAQVDPLGKKADGVRGIARGKPETSGREEALRE